MYLASEVQMHYFKNATNNIKMETKVSNVLQSVILIRPDVWFSFCICPDWKMSHILERTFKDDWIQNFEGKWSVSYEYILLKSKNKMG
jgi:hypothetical protein